MAFRSTTKSALARVAVATALLVTAAAALAQTVNDGCGDAGGGGGDVDRVSASFDPVLDEMVVNVRTCGPVSPTTKYRLRIDHYVNQEQYPAGSGIFIDAILSDGNPHCLDVADLQAMWNRKKGVGPGSVSVSGNTLEFRVKPAEFQPPVPSGRSVRLWVEAQTKGLVDRAPNTNASDGCAAPQYLGEATTVTVLYDPAGVVGTQAFDILRDPARLRESAMGNMVADSLRLSLPGVDAALMNSGGLRNDLPCTPPFGGEAACEIIWSELFRVLPFGNLAVIETITGAQLTAALQNGLAPSCNPALSTGRTAQVSGLQVSYTCAGSSVVINTLTRTPAGIGGTAIPIGPADSVRLVTNDFMASGGDGYLVLMGGTDVVYLERSLLEILAPFVTANSPVAPTVEGRIIKLTPAP
jgi:hypothetical protein